MELRHYGAIIWRWRWLALAIAAVTFAASFLIQTREPVLYQTTVRLALNPNLPLTQGDYSPAQHYYYENIDAEYLNDDIMEITESHSFRQAAVARASAALGRPVNGAIENKKAHKVMRFTITADDPDQAKALGTAIAELLSEVDSKYYNMLVSYEPTVTLADEIVVAQVTSPSRAYLYMLLRVLLALAAGLGLAFLLEYLDDTLRSARDVESAGLVVLAEIPAAGGCRRGPTALPSGEGRVQTA